MLTSIVFCRTVRNVHLFLQFLPDFVSHDRVSSQSRWIRSEDSRGSCKKDSNLSQRELAEKVGLVAKCLLGAVFSGFHSIGMIRGSHSDIDIGALGLDLIVFVMIRTRHQLQGVERRLQGTCRETSRSDRLLPYRRRMGLPDQSRHRGACPAMTPSIRSSSQISTSPP